MPARAAFWSLTRRDPKLQDVRELAGNGPARVQRVAVVSVHTCPLDQPGIGDSGGMNVYIRSVGKRLAEAGVEVDIFSRAAGRGAAVTVMEPGVRVIHLEAGPEEPVPKEELSNYLCAFLHSLMRFETAEAERTGAPVYDLVHSHYWLSGWVGRMVTERWEVPLVHSFHTLGRVKNKALAPGDAAEPPSRIAGEERVIASADCVLAPTIGEAAELVSLYRAQPDRVRVVAPGVETELFSPGDRDEAKTALGLGGRPVVLFVGRLQPLKSPDLAVDAVARMIRETPALGGAVLLVVGGPSGRSGVHPDRLRARAADLGIPGALRIVPPLPQAQLVRYYRAADVVVVPSRTESFGLVALEAESCGTPVVASNVGGLRTAVRDGVTGLLVRPDGPEEYARGLERLLLDDRLRRAMGAAGVRYARRFDWRQAASGLIGVYEEMVQSRAAVAGG